MEDIINLENAELFCDSASGIYIPQRFAKEVKRSILSGVSDKDLAILEAGPDGEWYWDAWNDVLDNAMLEHPTYGECRLYQDGDLWVVPFADMCGL